MLQDIGDTPDAIDPDVTPIIVTEWGLLKTNLSVVSGMWDET